MGSAAGKTSIELSVSEFSAGAMQHAARTVDRPYGYEVPSYSERLNAAKMHQLSRVNPHARTGSWLRLLPSFILTDRYTPASRG